MGNRYIITYPAKIITGKIDKHYMFCIFLFISS